MLQDLNQLTYPFYVNFLPVSDRNMVFVYVSQTFESTGATIEVTPNPDHIYYGPRFKVSPPAYMSGVKVAVVESIIKTLANHPTFVHQMEDAHVDRFVLLRLKSDGGGKLCHMDVTMDRPALSEEEALDPDAVIDRMLDAEHRVAHLEGKIKRARYLLSGPSLWKAKTILDSVN